MMMRILLALCVLFATMPAMAQDRLPPIPAEKQTPEQRKAAEAFRANRKQDVFGPFVPLHRSPEVMLRAMAMGDFLRYRTVFPTRLNEFIILITGIDDTFSQTVHSRDSYSSDEVVWGARFVDPYVSDDDGIIRVDPRRFHEIEPAALEG